jgi:putative oxidoreductase
VAIAAVHAGHGYTIAEGGWKLPLIYLVMFLPLILSGPGKLSLDHWLRGHYLKAERRLWS